MMEKEILKSTYFDRMSVYRPVRTEVDGVTKFKTKTSGEKILAEIECALSINGTKLVSNGVYHKTVGEYVIFAEPHLAIKSNDYIELVEENSRKHLFVVQDTKYYRSHIEIYVKEEKEV